jgi:hypothetical protein
MATPQNVLIGIIAFQRETGLAVSSQARSLIELVINAIERDPHPAWRLARADRRQVAINIAREVAPMLRAVAGEERVSEEVTTFHVLHWLSRNLDRACPIEK